MAVLNLCQFIGNVGKAPEIRVTASGSKVAKLSIAVTKKFKGRDNTIQESTEWIPLVAWEKKAEAIERFVGKGDPIYVSTEFKLKTWDAPDGTKKSAPEFNIVEIQFLKPRGAASAPTGGANYGSGGGYGAAPQNYGAPAQGDGSVDPNADDLPF